MATIIGNYDMASIDGIYDNSYYKLISKKNPKLFS